MAKLPFNGSLGPETPVVSLDWVDFPVALGAVRPLALTVF